MIILTLGSFKTWNSIEDYVHVISLICHLQREALGGFHHWACLQRVLVAGPDRQDTVSWELLHTTAPFIFVYVTKVSAVLFIFVVLFQQPWHKLFLFTGFHKKTNQTDILKNLLKVCGGIMRSYIPHRINAHLTTPLNIL